MRILYLGPKSPLLKWLKDSDDNFDQTEKKIETATGYDIIISYRYRHKLSAECLASVDYNAVNLHTSMLPFNRGADPVLWSIATDSPQGVTVHWMDEHIDTGPLIAQLSVAPLPDDTMGSYYDRMQVRVQRLFMEVWPAIRNGQAMKEPQPMGGSYHELKDKEILLEQMPLKSETPVQDVLGLYNRL